MIDPRKNLNNLLSKWGHNILLQELINNSNMTYSSSVKQYTVRSVYPGSKRIF